MKNPNIKLLSTLLIIFVAGCASFYQTVNFEELYGPSYARERSLTADEYKTSQQQGKISFHDDVQPILENRCAACHGCYDAPCQLKLSSFEGLDRGGSKELVYNGERLRPMLPSRLLIDADNTAQWREKDFHPVLNEREQAEQANLQNSLLYKMLDLKRTNPLPDSELLPDNIDLGLDRKQVCPTISEFNKFASDHPLWGMPYALPALNDNEFNTISQWLAEGGLVSAYPPIPKQDQQQITQWEAFLNGNSLKEQLVSRYIYEHLFVGHLHFKNSERQFYRLIRSSTASGTKAKELSTLRPYDDPEVNFYYRLIPINESIVEKNHIAYDLSPAKMSRYKELFYQPTYQVTEAPIYEPRITANPFKVFREIPAQSRYQFLLDDARYFIMGFMKGPVCRGQIALNVIQDQFWVAFFDPTLDKVSIDDDFLFEQSQYLKIPSASGNDVSIIDILSRYHKTVQTYNNNKDAFLNTIKHDNKGNSLDLIWDGNKTNKNAALTIFRHFDSATVTYGFQGDTPKTAWVIDYPLFERIHYLLVAGFDVYGTISHQLATRTYFNFLRMEGENNFLSFMPNGQREPMRDYWYAGVDNTFKPFLDIPLHEDDRPVQINYQTDKPRKEFFTKLRQHLAAAAGNDDTINRCEKEICLNNNTPDFDQRVERELIRLTKMQGFRLNAFPDLSMLKIIPNDPKQQSKAYSIIRDRFHTNVAFIFGEEKRRNVDNDKLSILPGVVGAYPNIYFSIHEDELANFVDLLLVMEDHDDYYAFARRFAIRRNNPDFWKHADWFNAANVQLDPLGGGLLDLNRYQNR